MRGASNAMTASPSPKSLSVRPEGFRVAINSSGRLRYRIDRVLRTNHGNGSVRGGNGVQSGGSDHGAGEPYDSGEHGRLRLGGIL